jgi:DNA-binding response OmpR family regulator
MPSSLWMRTAAFCGTAGRPDNRAAPPVARRGPDRGPPVPPNSVAEPPSGWSRMIDGAAQRKSDVGRAMADQGSSGHKVLVVDDAPEFIELVVPLLEREGYTTLAARDGESAINDARSFEPDVIVLDLGLPKVDGVDVCRQVRGFSDAYVIMLTARSEEVDRVVGLEVGADDYMTKPFSPRELVARVRAMLRRPRTNVTAGTEEAQPRVFGNLEVDPLSHTVRVDGAETALTRIEFDLLESLTSKPTMVFSRALLRERVWGPDWYGDDHVVDVHIANLRKKIDKNGDSSHIRTVRGVGYRMAS